MYRAHNIPGKLGQNNACWCPGSWRHQVISWYKKGHVGLVTVTGTIKVVLYPLTHRGRVTHICVSKLAIIGSDNGLSPGWRQAIIWTNAGILIIGPLGTNFHEILIEIHTFSFRKMHLKMLSGKWRPSCLGLNVLTEAFLIGRLGTCRYHQLKPNLQMSCSEMTRMIWYQNNCLSNGH